MKTTMALTLLMAAAMNGPIAIAAADKNPFYQASKLQYEYPPFNQIKDAHYLPAFEKGMAQNRAEINAIANNKKPPSFDNTIVAMEKSGVLLTRVSNVFFNLSGANTNSELEKIQSQLAPKLAAHGDEISLNAKLFERISALYERREGLKPDAKRLLERYYVDFVRSGAKLNAADKEKLKLINSQLAELGTSFSQNVLKEVNASALILDRIEDLDGLSEAEISAAKEAAKARKLEGKYVLALQNTSQQPPLTTLKNRAVREKLLSASLARGSHGGEFDNRDNVAKISKLRAERARLLGYVDHATYSLEDQTAAKPEIVNKLMRELAPAAVANAKREAADMQILVDAQKGGFTMSAADWNQYAEQVRKARYDFDEAQLKPYFELESVMQNGVFFAANKLYGLNFKERKDLPVYHPDVRVFEVFDENKKSLAIFIADLYARESKRGGAWMNEYVSQSKLFKSRPVVGNHLNIPKPADGEPTLLTFDEASTFFHEFGHALHGMFSNVTYPRFSGTNVPRDFVEYPSQVNEMWATWPEVLKNYAKHYKTGEQMPQALLDKVLAAQQFNQGYSTTEYLAAALLDQAWHQVTPENAPSADKVLDFEANALKQVGLDYSVVPARYRTTYFSHIFGGGYAAGYYSYLWSEVLDAESVDWFKENGGLTRANGDHFRKTLLSLGGSVDAMQMFKNFRGRAPELTPLLKRRGLLAPTQ